MAESGFPEHIIREIEEIPGYFNFLLNPEQAEGVRRLKDLFYKGPYIAATNVDMRTGEERGENKIFIQGWRSKQSGSLYNARYDLNGGAIELFRQSSANETETLTLTNPLKDLGSDETLVSWKPSRNLKSKFSLPVDTPERTALLSELPYIFSDADFQPGGRAHDLVGAIQNVASEHFSEMLSVFELGMRRQVRNHRAKSFIGGTLRRFAVFRRSSFSKP